ncbi:PAS domain-containing protein [Sulfuricurvum sp.]|uniref:PAS domain-containing protein n=1 Tax=Sulfuricurvum sp. TaxID=2025608 RepID=UPI002608AFA4|nr:PAS domain-containing protein [Sulfuricurvum sp.]MDD3598491.1 PAS domain-containing protein [Sulfuricurvum sp.]MDD4883973.1 PAS domain-containing protein [Sulfuricurvum sp.]
MQKPTPNQNEKRLNASDFIVSKTDKSGKIIYGNKYFIKISGYEEDELIGSPHSILRHPDMPKVVFKLLWERIQNKEEIFAYVKNLCKDGSYYWVFANATATLDEKGMIRDFHSVRRKPSQKAMEIIPSLYTQLLLEEHKNGMNGSQRLLEKILNDKGVDYDEFILSLQQ